MYENWFQLEQPPFENTPNPRFFYASEQHREALAAIEYSIRLRKGIVLVTGDVGSGKTTIAKATLHRCAEQATIVQLLHGHRTGTELLRQILRTLSVPVRGNDDHALLLERLAGQLHRYAKEDRPVVLFVDEAQSLSDEALEELRLLSNFDMTTLKLLQLVLIGQPELRDRIAEQRFAALRQRIFMAKRLKPFDVVETASYIRHRLVAAGKDRQNVKAVFDNQAIEQIQAFSGGLPRLINVVCDNCLLMAYVRQSKTVDMKIVRRVVDDMAPNFDGVHEQAQPTQRLALARSA